MRTCFIILLILCTNFAFPQGGENEVLRVVPPEDLQTGGEQIRNALDPFQGTTNMFVGQQLDLSMLGPGTNVSFVMSSDGEEWGFSLSNGRFEEVKEYAGSIEAGTYPSIDFSQREGKYPWPRDADGKFISSDLVNSSNGPHTEMMELLKSDSKGEKTYIAGHIGIAPNGQAYIGYISQGVNGSLPKTSWGEDLLKIKGANKVDARSLPPGFRNQLHSKMNQVFEGRGIKEITERANLQLNPRFLHAGKMKFYPFDPLTKQQHKIDSTFQYLREKLPGEKFGEYLFRAEPRSVGIIISSNDFKDYVSEGSDIASLGDLSLSENLNQKKQIFNQFTSYLDNFPYDDPEKVGKFIVHILSSRQLRDFYTDDAKRKFDHIIQSASPEFTKYLNSVGDYFIPKRLLSKEELIELAKTKPDLAASLYRHKVQKYNPPLEFDFDLSQEKYKKLRNAVMRHHLGETSLSSYPWYKPLVDKKWASQNLTKDEIKKLKTHPGNIFLELMEEDFETLRPSQMFSQRAYSDIDQNLPTNETTNRRIFNYFMKRAKEAKRLTKYDRAFIEFAIKHHDEAIFQTILYQDGLMKDYFIKTISAEKNGAERLAKGIMRSSSYYGTLTYKGRRSVIKEVMNTDLLPKEFKQDVFKEIFIHGNYDDWINYIDLEDPLTQKAIGNFLNHSIDASSEIPGLRISDDLSHHAAFGYFEKLDNNQKQLVRNYFELMSKLKKADPNILASINFHRKTNILPFEFADGNGEPYDWRNNYFELISNCLDRQN